MVTEKMIEAFVKASSVAYGDTMDCVRAGLEAALSTDAEPLWWLVTTDMGKVIFHGADKDRADRVAAIHGREAQGLYASPRAGATQVKDIAIPGVKLGIPMLQALSRLAGSRHSDGTSSIVSAEDRSVIIDTCHAIMTGAAALSAQVQDVAEYERREKACKETAMSQWERSLKRPDLSEKDRVIGAIEAYKRQAFAFAFMPSEGKGESAS